MSIVDSVHLLCTSEFIKKVVHKCFHHSNKEKFTYEQEVYFIIWAKIAVKDIIGTSGKSRTQTDLYNNVPKLVFLILIIVW